MTVDHLDAEVEFGVMVAFAATETELPEARRASHDAVIEWLGSRRRSGVRWFQYDASDTVRILGELGFPVTPEMREWLASYPDGFLVVAMAEAVPE